MNEQYASRLLASFLIFGFVAVGFFGYALYEANQPAPALETAANSPVAADAPSVPADNQAATPATDPTAASTGQQFPASAFTPIKATTQAQAKTVAKTSPAATKKPVPSKPVPVTPSAPAADTPPATKYRNGTYSATGSYDSPGGYDQLGVSVTISNDVVTSAAVTPMARDRTSSRYQQMFISGYKQYVVGRSVDSIQLDRVSGSSLTGQGFNDALSQIKTQAAA